MIYKVKHTSTLQEELYAEEQEEEIEVKGERGIRVIKHQLMT